MTDQAYFKCCCCGDTDLMVHPPTEPQFEEKLLSYNVPLLDEDSEVIINQVQRKDEDGQPMTRPVYKRDRKGHILFDKHGGKIVEKMVAAMIGEIQYEVKKRKKLVPKMLKTKLKHPHSHEMVDHEIQEVKDLKPRILLLQCRVVGRDTIQKNFCTKCFDKKVKPEMKKFFAFLNGIREKK